MPQGPMAFRAINKSFGIPRPEAEVLLIILEDTATIFTFDFKMFIRFQVVGTAGLEPATSWSRTKRTTNCAMSRRREIFLARGNIALRVQNSKSDIWFVSPKPSKTPRSVRILISLSESLVRSWSSSFEMKAPFCGPPPRLSAASPPSQR
jgi:hypothetical protein